MRRPVMVAITVLLALIAGAIPAPASGAEPAPEYAPLGDEPMPLIYRGQDVSNPGWIVALFRNDEYVCTGSLIDPRFVLTAAHCVDEPAAFSVLVGEEYLYAAGVRRGVVRVSIHPGWRGLFNDTDLALLELDGPVGSVPTVRINPTGAWPELGQVVGVAGWGRYTDTSGPSPYLQAASFYATSGMDGRYDPFYCDLAPSAMVVGGGFCFGGPVDASACSGDSGGPVYGYTTPSASAGDLVVYGVVSYGEVYCGPQSTDAVAQSVGGNYPWIASVAGWGAGPHTVALVDPSSGLWYLFDPAGMPVSSFYFGNPGDEPIVGDWNGDGVETPGMYRRSDGYVYLRNSNTQGVADIRFFFGNPGDVPIAGDFDGDGFDTVSIYRPSEQRFYIINRLGQNEGGLGAAELNYVFGDPGDKPFVGDFDGDGVETVGLHRESTGLVYFRNSHTQGVADYQFFFGDPGDRLVAGDWAGFGTFSPGLFRPSNTTVYLRFTNTQGVADFRFLAGQSGWIPVSGRMGTG
jgi:hypothetical protein